jgi:flagellar basal-body rod modification protein FlgD
MSDMTTSSAASTSTLSTSGTSLSPSATSGLGQNDFLSLMMDQLKNQDPLDPGDPTQYLSELANFSSLEAQTNTATSTASAAAEQASSSALSLLGHTVDYTDPTSGDVESGTVSKVSFTSSGPTLTIGTATGIPIGSITDAS